MNSILKVRYWNRRATDEEIYGKRRRKQMYAADVGAFATVAAILIIIAASIQSCVS